MSTWAGQCYVAAPLCRGSDIFPAGPIPDIRLRKAETVYRASAFPDVFPRPGLCYRGPRFRIFHRHSSMKSTAHFFSVIVMVLLGLAACDRDGSTNPNTDPVAEQKAAVLLDALKAGDLDTALAQYSDAFFKNRSREEWRDQLAKLNEGRGPMQDYILRRAQADTRLSGKFFILEYEGVYLGRQRVNHILTLVSPVTGEGIQLVGHKLTPWEVEE